jgi:aerotolerance regulator-like protein/VWA domain-containing protein
VSFLAPIWLALAGAVAVPLLIHLLRRRIGTRVEFPAARYLARAEQEHSRSLRMRNLLLMLLRVAIVLVLATAAARPVTRWVGAGHAPTALAIVIDNSLSSSAVVDGRPVLDELKGAARTVLDASAAGDRLWIVTADGRVRGGSASSLRSELERIEALAGGADLQRAISRAAAAVRSAGLDAKQVAVLSDGQRTSWNANYELADAQALLYLSSKTPPPNRAVVSVEARPVRWTPRGAIVARIQSRDSTTYRMVLASRSLARGTSGPNEEVTLHAAPPERGWLAGSVELEPDEMPADNVRHFAVWIGAAPGVTLTPGAGPFASSALDVLLANQRIARGRDITLGPADEITSLPALIVAPNDAVHIGAANRALERLGVPWRFGAASRGQETVRGAGLEETAVTLRYALVPQVGASADTLASAGRDPWIVSGPRYVIVASPLAPEATSFPVRASFVPWLSDVLTERLVGEPGQVLTSTPGNRLARPSWADAIESPGGARQPLEESFDVPAQTGTYFFERGGRRVGALVVDPPPDESTLDREPPQDIERRFRARAVLRVTDATKWSTLAFRAASRRALVEPLLLAVIALLAVETLFARAGASRVA